MDPELCPECARTGKLSRLEYLVHDEVSIILCEDNDCSFNDKGNHVVRRREDSPLPPTLLRRLCPELIPVTLLREPKLKYRHLMMLIWLNTWRKGIYCWLQEEVDSMAYSRLEHLRGRVEARYQPTPSAKQMMDLTDEEIHVGKHIVPDLRKIVTTLKVQYRIHLLLEK